MLAAARRFGRCPFHRGTMRQTSIQTKPTLQPWECVELTSELRRWVSQQPFPEDYLVLDVATSGPDIASDVIVGLGLCIVRDRRVQDRVHLALDWTQEP